MRTTGANLLAAAALICNGAFCCYIGCYRCVPIVRTGLRTSVGQLAPTGISRAPECVTIVREASFMGLFLQNGIGDPVTMDVVTAGGHRDWSLAGAWLVEPWLAITGRRSGASSASQAFASRRPTTNMGCSCGYLASPIKNLYCPVTFATRHGV